MEKKHIKTLLTSLQGRRVMIVGDVMVDEFLYGNVERISPEAPVPVLEFLRTEFMPGGAANAANNIHALGGMPFLVGYIGDDTTGRKLTSVLEERGIRTDGLIISQEHPTILKTRIVAHSQQMLRIDREIKDCIDERREFLLLDYIKQQFLQPNIDVVLVCDYKKGVVSPKVAKLVIRLAKQYRKSVIVDTKLTNLEIFKGITLLTPNIHEIEAIIGSSLTNEAAIIDAGKKLNLVLRSSAILVTRAEKGMLLVARDGSTVNFPALVSQVSDVTGAGDTVAAVFALVCAAGKTNFADAAFVANLAAGVVVRKVGTATATLSEIIHLFEEMEIEMDKK